MSSCYNLPFKLFAKRLGNHMRINKARVELLKHISEKLIGSNGGCRFCLTKSSSEEKKMLPDIFVIIFGGRFGGRFWNSPSCMEATHTEVKPSALIEVPLFTLGEGPIFQLKIGSTSRRWVLDFNYKFLLLETALTSSSCDSINFWVELYIHRRNNMALDIFVVIFGGRFGGRFWNCRTGMETIHGLRAGHNPHQESTRGIEDAPGNWKRFCSTSRWLWRCARDPFGRDRIRQKISFLVILSLVVRSMHMLATAQLLALENGSIVSFIIEDTWFIVFASLCVSPVVTF